MKSPEGGRRLSAPIPGRLHHKDTPCQKIEILNPEF